MSFCDIIVPGGCICQSVRQTYTGEWHPWKVCDCCYCWRFTLCLLRVIYGSYPVHINPPGVFWWLSWKRRETNQFGSRNTVCLRVYRLAYAFLSLFVPPPPHTRTPFIYSLFVCLIGWQNFNVTDFTADYFCCFVFSLYDDSKQWQCEWILHISCFCFLSFFLLPLNWMMHSESPLHVVKINKQ